MGPSAANRERSGRSAAATATAAATRSAAGASGRAGRASGQLLRGGLRHAGMQRGTEETVVRDRLHGRPGRLEHGRRVPSGRRPAGAAGEARFRAAGDRGEWNEHDPWITWSKHDQRAHGAAEPPRRTEDGVRLQLPGLQL